MRRPSALHAGVASSGLAFVATAIIQVASVPIFLATVGVQGFATWLVASAVPQYLSLTDMGFAAASATEATKRIIKGDTVGANRAMSSGWLVVSSASLLFSVVASVLALWLWPSVGDDEGYAPAAVVFVILIFWVALWMQVGFFEGAFRAYGRYPTGINFATGIRVIEFTAMAISVALSQSLIVAALALLCARFLGACVMYFHTRRSVQWFSISPTSASREDVKLLLKPSITFAGLIAGQAIVNQGMLLVVAAQLGDAATVVFSAVRTMVNVLQQICIVVTDGSLAVLTRASAMQSPDQVARIERATRLMASIPTVAVGVLLCFVGQQIMAVWTTSRVVASQLFIIAMVATTLADIPWRLLTNRLRALNLHHRVGTVFLFAAIATLGLAWVLLPLWGLLAVPIAALLLDILVTPVAYRDVCNLELFKENNVAAQS